MTHAWSWRKSLFQFFFEGGIGDDGTEEGSTGGIFYKFSQEDHVPQDRLLRSIEQFVDLASIRAHLSDFQSHTGRPSVDP